MLNFQLGYYKKSEKRWIHNQRDLKEALELMKHNEKFTLWCVGLSHDKATKKNKHQRETDSPDHDPELETERCAQPSSAKKKKLSSKEERETRVSELKKDLSQRHGPKYSGVQYRLWAEMIVGGMHESLTEAPSAPMFGAKRPCRQSSQNSELSEALTGMATTIVSMLSPQNQVKDTQSTAVCSSYASPNKAADGAGECDQGAAVYIFPACRSLANDKLLWLLNICSMTRATSDFLCS